MGETQKEANNDDKIDDGSFDEDKSKKTKSQNESADIDSSDDEQGDDDNDATGIKLKSRKMDETEYDDPEDVEEINDG